MRLATNAFMTISVSVKVRFLYSVPRRFVYVYWKVKCSSEGVGLIPPNVRGAPVLAGLCSASTDRPCI